MKKIFFTIVLSFILSYSKPNYAQYTGGSNDGYESKTINNIALANVVNIIRVETNLNNFILHQNFPNPFNPVTTISFELPELSVVSLQIFDITGRLVSKLIDAKTYIPGTYNLRTDFNSSPSGIYFYKLTVNGNLIDTKSMILIK
ncbi:MAG TPA: T9SS type A sorting domain-containing protein [Ignavibacteria bacterium]|nr:T9SS type A sorting domain-containing protein [Ignavibacteria bacterium]